MALSRLEILVIEARPRMTDNCDLPYKLAVSDVSEYLRFYSFVTEGLTFLLFCNIRTDNATTRHFYFVSLSVTL